MIEEKELFKEFANALIFNSGHQNIIWAEDLFDIQIVPYSGKLKEIPEYSQMAPRLELYGLVIVKHRSRDIQIVDVKADVEKNRLYISESSYRAYWHEMRESIAWAMSERHIDAEPASCVDRSLLRRKKPARSQIKPVDPWERRKQSLLDNRECMFYYDKDGDTFHDRDCRELSKINSQTFQAAKTRPEGMGYCPKCAHRLYARIACYPNSKEVDAVEHLIRRHFIGREQWMTYVEDFDMKIHVTTLSEVRVFCHEDSWIIRISEDGSMSLWHNNYIRTDAGGRYIVDGFHEQGYKTKNLKFLLDVISRYDWTAYHQEPDECEGKAGLDEAEAVIGPNEADSPEPSLEKISPQPQPAWGHEDAVKTECDRPILRTFFDRALSNPITQSVMARLEELRKAKEK